VSVEGNSLKLTLEISNRTLLRIHQKGNKVAIEVLQEGAPKGKFVTLGQRMDLCLSEDSLDESFSSYQAFDLQPLREDKVALRGQNGLYVNGEMVASPKDPLPFVLLNIQTICDKLGGEHCPSLPKDPSGTVPEKPHVKDMFSDQGHHWIVDSAFLLLLGCEKLQGVSVLKGFHEDSVFMINMYEGLKDADYKKEYKGIMDMWECHFYHPETKRNLFGGKDTALYRAGLYYKIALENLRKIQTERTDESVIAAAYNLGLVLHYVTDLCQPLHATNFGNFISPDNWAPSLGDMRHAGYEDYVEDVVANEPLKLAGWKPKTIDPKDFELNYTFTKLEDLVIKAADNSVAIYKKTFEATILAKKKSHFSFENKWTPEQADPTLVEVVPNSVLMAASLFIHWARNKD